MEYFLQQLINGVTLGSIYGLIAIGYTMVYGIIGMTIAVLATVFGPQVTAHAGPRPSLPPAGRPAARTP